MAPDHYAFEAVEWAAEAEVTVGYGDGTFKPQRPLNRHHAVVFLQRYYDKILGADESDDFTRGDMMVLLKAINDGTIRGAPTTTTTTTTTPTATTTTTLPPAGSPALTVEVTECVATERPFGLGYSVSIKGIVYANRAVSGVTVSRWKPDPVLGYAGDWQWTQDRLGSLSTGESKSFRIGTKPVIGDINEPIDSDCSVYVSFREE